MLELCTEIKEGTAAFSLEVSKTQCRRGGFEKCLAQVLPPSHERQLSGAGGPFALSWVCYSTSLKGLVLCEASVKPSSTGTANWDYLSLV